MQKTSDINVVETRALHSPADLLAELPKTEAQAEFVTRARREIHRVIFTDDKRFLLIVGPCSIHDLEAGRDYARRLAPLAREVADRIMIVMRVYFEKPRTTVGWKGLVMDPHLDGSASAIVTRGNPDCHTVLRGGAGGPNYSPAHIAQTEQLLAKAGLIKSILVDCSHDNSAKQPERQPEVLRDLLRQISAGNTTIMGAMIESNLGAGSQPFPQPREKLRYGVSITDACIDWPTTAALVRELHAALAPRFA